MAHLAISFKPGVLLTALFVTRIMYSLSSLVMLASVATSGEIIEMLVAFRTDVSTLEADKKKTI